MSLMVIRLSATEEKAISERAALCGKDKNEWVRESFVFSLKRMRMAAAFAELRSSLAPLGAQLYFWGRVAFLPLYALGWPALRTVAWTVSLAGIVLVLLSCLPGL